MAGRAPHEQDRASSHGLSLLHAFRAVAWSFFGIRKGSEYEKDVSRLRAWQVIVAGLVAVALFVTALVLLIKWIVGSGVAG